MPVTYASKDLIEQCGISYAEAEEGIIRLGGEVKIEENKLVFEVGANRWDLFTPEGIVNAILLLMGKKKPYKFECNTSGIVIQIDHSVKPVRPFVVGAVVENIEIDRDYIGELMQIQEKLHETIGRKRRKLAIGIHDLDKVSPPFTYQALKPDSIAFEPLGFNDVMNLREILERHPKGIEYSWILEGADRYPVILDENGNVLSFPPVINGKQTEVTENTRNLFIDMTGTDLRTIKSALNVLTYSMLLRGGKIKSVEIRDEGQFHTPDYTWKRKMIKKEEIVSLLGMEIPSAPELLERMGYIVAESGDWLEVEVPPYRCDVMHNVDIIEDVGIAYGYDSIRECMPRTFTVGKPSPLADIEEMVRKFFIGMGAQEIQSFVLGSEKELFINMGLKLEEMKVVRAKNPKSMEYSIARHSLLPGILKAIYINQRHPLPVRFFEIGLVLEPEEKRKCCFATVHSKASFSEIKSIVESFLQEFEVEFTLEPFDTPYFINGRGAKIVKNNSVMGVLGEVHPSTLEKFGIGNPVAAFEILRLDLLLCQRDFNR